MDNQPQSEEMPSIANAASALSPAISSAPVLRSPEIMKVADPITDIDTVWPDPMTDDMIDTLELLPAHERLKKAEKAIHTLVKQLKAAKSSISHYHLQTQLLTIEAHESQQRQLVESQIAKRQVDLLRPDQNANVNVSDELMLMQDLAETYRRRLYKAKQRLKETQTESAEKSAEIMKLKERLRRYVISPTNPPLRRYSGNILPTPTVTSLSRTHSHPSVTFHHSQASSSQHSAAESGLDTLGMLATQVLSQEEQPSSMRDASSVNTTFVSPPGSSSQQEAAATSQSKTPQRPENTLPPLLTPQSGPNNNNKVYEEKLLRSPVNMFSEQNQPPTPVEPGIRPQKRRRRSSASTISEVSEDEMVIPRRLSFNN
ncbi:hypothetical protein CANCADRAFT_93029 [Tortispora caseinolytica NRRL Y-17796]|uniref:Uncharacterized protein n=1 Tax=Tortispora caseinolytica NRRL Y-17796 TaxID=767744 RepID=A0A1E4TM09_9ASCO|nr:hypothetical protein CANCADRAFT_93029 [Tortispora caseinolytica NRRL Y-17796]